MAAGKGSSQESRGDSAKGCVAVSKGQGEELLLERLMKRSEESGKRGGQSAEPQSQA
jgi:hypothetical protein